MTHSEPGHGEDLMSVERAGMLMADAAYEQVRAERDALRSELEHAQHMFALVVAAAGGRVTVTEQAIVGDTPTIISYDTVFGSRVFKVAASDFGGQEVDQ